ncbi:hypothetical protein GCM10011505_27780 [Tistrella bauzanensis]|uniref:DUF3325 domain-containing protein n=1 Tax=Tistrella bauzanensis TaxID=657419 RepID=A0ABQ1ILH8_9PROT|nr:DUF3325 domain-containing protein [Tistrella bauzanensis]GGB44918.1 hypothetical protein GCM10011505_27780 [Tistrella bauzanensis]
MIPLLTLAVGVSAAVTLALAMPRHHDQCHGRGARAVHQPVRRRLEGGILVALAAGLVMSAEGWGRGPVWVAGVAGLAGPLAAALFAWAPGWARRLARLGWLFAGAGLCLIAAGAG